MLILVTGSRRPDAEIGQVGGADDENKGGTSGLEAIYDARDSIKSH